MEYVSVSLASKNENGREELAVHRRLSFLEQLVWAWQKRTLNPPLSWVDVYEVRGTVWVDKRTGETPGFDTQHECFVLKGDIKRNIRMDKFIGDLK